jgi:hypothetical protein
MPGMDDSERGDGDHGTAGVIFGWCEVRRFRWEREPLSPSNFSFVI